MLFSLDQGYLVRYDFCGNQLFAREIDLPGNPELVDLIALSNGDFGLLAASANIRRDAIVARLDSSGNLLWINQYQDANFDQRQFPYSLVEISSDRLCYYANMESLSTNDTRNLLLWLDAQERSFRPRPTALEEYGVVASLQQIQACCFARGIAWSR